MRYIHSGDQIETDQKKDRSAQQKSPEKKTPEQEDQPAASQSGKGQELEASAELGAVTGQKPPEQKDQPAASQSDIGQELEASAELGAVTRPIEGGQESPSGLDAPPDSGGDGNEAARAASHGEAGGGQSAAAGEGEDSSGKNAASGDGGAVGGKDAAATDNEASPGDDSASENGDGQESSGGGIKGFFSSLFGDDAGPEEASAESGTGDQAADDSQQGIQGAEDSASAGFAGPESADSEGAGAPGQTGAAQAGTDHSGTDHSAADSGAGQGAHEDGRGQSQDMETSDELGAQTQDKSHKGFFARLFGDDEEPEDQEDGQEAGQPQQPKQSAPKKSAPKKAKSQQGADSASKSNDPLQQKRDNERSDSLEQSITYWQGNDKIPQSLADAKNTLTEVLGLGSSFDIVFREMSFGGKSAALLCISGFAKDTIIDEILKRLTYLTPENVSADVLASFMSEYIPHVQVEKGELFSESINKVLAGMSVFFIEGESQVIIMDTRSYPSRSPDEPSIERVVRGSRDGFTETLLSNVALVRRRIRDPGLKLEMHQIGRRTRTDVCLAYIDDIVDKTQVQAVTDKLKSVNLDGIPLADKQLEEAIVGGGWNPYPLVRYSERPDIVASHLLEGRVVVFVDTSPSVMVLPTTFFDLCQHAEENRQTPFMGTYLRWVRFIGIFASMFLLPLWMLMVLHPELKPGMLDFIGPQKSANLPLIAQFLIVELGVDLLRMAAVHTPTPLGSAMGLIAAILVGDIAVQTGLFVNEVVLYMAVASIGMFATPSYELGLANRIVRLALLLAVAAYGIPGFMIGTTLLVVLLTTHRSYNSPYMWPFIPFNAKAMAEILLRQPVLSSKTRPSFNKTRDSTRMPEHKDAPRKS
ncbi:stage V sporulation protein AF [Paenibacillus silagei]|uniref:Stage V sporulation protein AF n=1 Tax=Paenibacillus silagei TaxID=1670801 RepID=A0ABS4NLI5_9BACL|nr:stage V sporulation protein AF [Paenibacillus silagei]